MSGLTALSAPGLFLTCVQYFDLIQLGRNLKDDFAACSLKLDAARVHLLRWGTAIDIANKLAGYPQKEVQLALRSLKSIETQFKRAEEDSGSFKELAELSGDSSDAKQAEVLEPGVELELASKEHKAANAALAKINHSYRRKTLNAIVGAHNRTRWALYQKKNLNSLVDEISKQVAELEKLFPDIATKQAQLAKTDVASLDNDALAVLPALLGTTDPVFTAAMSQQIEARGIRVKDVKYEGFSKNRMGNDIAAGYKGPDARSSINLDTVTATDYSENHIGDRIGY